MYYTKIRIRPDRHEAETTSQTERNEGIKFQSWVEEWVEGREVANEREKKDKRKS